MRFRPSTTPRIRRGRAAGIRLRGAIFTTVTEAYAHDPFPCELTPPIVHIDRERWQGGDWFDAGRDRETRIKGRVTHFDGRFAGT